MSDPHRPRPTLPDRQADDRSAAGSHDDAPLWWLLAGAIVILVVLITLFVFSGEPTGGMAGP